MDRELPLRDTDVLLVNATGYDSIVTAGASVAGNRMSPTLPVKLAREKKSKVENVQNHDECGGLKRTNSPSSSLATAADLCCLILEPAKDLDRTESVSSQSRAFRFGDRVVLEEVSSTDEVGLKCMGEGVVVCSPLQSEDGWEPNVVVASLQTGESFFLQPSRLKKIMTAKDTFKAGDLVQVICISKASIRSIHLLDTTFDLFNNCSL